MDTRTAAMRRDYGLGGLEETAAGSDPLALFRRWLDDAVAAGLDEPNAMTLATLGEDGAPDARIVLLKGFDERGFAFYSNFGSAKGRQLAAAPHAALVFHWSEHERQVRIRGAVGLVDRAETDEYFATRPRASQIGAWASEQSAFLPDRAALEAGFRAAEERFGAAPIPAPPHWGGYRVAPATVEFWQGRRSRLHDRLRFARGAGGWRRERLAP